MDEVIDPADGEVTAVEIAAQIVEALRATGQYHVNYDREDERAVLQRAGRIARAALKPRRITVRSIDGVFVAIWTDPTPLENELHRIKMAETVNAIQPKNWQQRLRRPDAP